MDHVCFFRGSHFLKGLFACVTLKWLFIGVSTLMSYQIATLHESLSAHSASVALIASMPQSLIPVS